MSQTDEIIVENDRLRRAIKERDQRDADAATGKSRIPNELSGRTGLYLPNSVVSIISVGEVRGMESTIQTLMKELEEARSNHD